jgi:hypothetical protein
VCFCFVGVCIIEAANELPESGRISVERGVFEKLFKSSVLFCSDIFLYFC